MLHLLFNQQIYGIFDNYPTVMPVFLLFEMFYFQQFLTYQECHIFTIHPANSSTLWWNQQPTESFRKTLLSFDLPEIYL